MLRLPCPAGELRFVFSAHELEPCAAGQVCRRCFVLGRNSRGRRLATVACPVPAVWEASGRVRAADPPFGKCGAGGFSCSAGRPRGRLLPSARWPRWACGPSSRIGCCNLPIVDGRCASGAASLPAVHARLRRGPAGRRRSYRDLPCWRSTPARSLLRSARRRQKSKHAYGTTVSGPALGIGTPRASDRVRQLRAHAASRGNLAALGCRQSAVGGRLPPCRPRGVERRSALAPATRLWGCPLFCPRRGCAPGKPSVRAF